MEGGREGRTKGQRRKHTIWRLKFEERATKQISKNNCKRKKDRKRLEIMYKEKMNEWMGKNRTKEV